MNEKNINTTKVELHPRNGMKMEIYDNWFVKICIGIALLFISAGLGLLFAAPFVWALK